MRDFFIVIVLALTAAFVADQVWFAGKYRGALQHDIGWEFSSASRR